MRTQVKRLLPDPASLRNVSYPWDPSLPLDDVIQWPSPAAQPSSRPTGTEQGAPVPTCSFAAGCTRGPALAAAGPAAASASPCSMSEEPDEAPSLASNQQRKDAILAKQGGDSGIGRISSHPLPSDATAQAVSAAADALKAASLQPKHTSLTGASHAPACGEGRGMPAPLECQVAPATCGGRAAQPADGAALVGGPPRADGYLAQYVQQQGRPCGTQPAGASGGGKLAGGGGRAVNLTASSGSAAWGGVLDPLPGEEPPQRMDLRPSELTVSEAEDVCLPALHLKRTILASLAAKADPLTCTVHRSPCPVRQASSQAPPWHACSVFCRGAAPPPASRALVDRRAAACLPAPRPWLGGPVGTTGALQAVSAALCCIGQL